MKIILIPININYNLNTEINECLSNPCHNGAECLNLVNAYKCKCKTGFFGHSCESKFIFKIYLLLFSNTLITERAACFNNPCKSGGTCNIDSDGAEVCLCKDGFTGTFCEIDINECSSSPCQNGGTCIDLENSYACYCPDGYFRPTYCPPQETFTQPAIMIPSTSNISFLFI